jgi:hypothetical protein
MPEMITRVGMADGDMRSRIRLLGSIPAGMALEKRGLSGSQPWK